MAAVKLEWSQSSGLDLHERCSQVQQTLESSVRTTIIVCWNLLSVRCNLIIVITTICIHSWSVTNLTRYVVLLFKTLMVLSGYLSLSTNKTFSVRSRNWQGFGANGNVLFLCYQSFQVLPVWKIYSAMETKNANEFGRNYHLEVALGQDFKFMVIAWLISQRWHVTRQSGYVLKGGCKGSNA